VGKLSGKRDVYAGLLITLLGCSVAVHSVTAYRLGTTARVGPGMFPAILGVLTALVGLMIIVAGAMTSPIGPDECFPHFELRGWSCIIGGPLAFIFAGEHFGMLAATFSCVFIAAFGDKRTKAMEAALLAAGITVLGYLVFGLLLRVPFPMVRWSI
jgi:hypothetical protein